MSPIKLAITAGFAMFSMFFGSGNLVFPLLVGSLSKSNYCAASLGLLLTGVIVPFIGLIAMLYANGNRMLFFNKLPKKAVLVLLFSMLSLMGPFGVLPRCVIVAHGGLNLVAPALNAPLFNALFLALTGALVWKKDRIVEIIGNFLTPWLLGGIFMIIILGLIFGPAPQIAAPDADIVFSIGMTQGYQTMDLLAAFFFSATAVTFIASKLKSHEDRKKIEKISLSACLIGALLLACVYIGFVKLGASFAPVIQGIPSEKLLVVIAGHVLGAYALPIAAIVICLACLTTATILTTLFADFVAYDLLKKPKLRHMMVLVTLLIAYGISLFGFGPLASWIQSALFVAYPALIAYALLSILEHKLGKNYVRLGFYSTFLISLILKGAFALDLL